MQINFGEKFLYQGRIIIFEKTIGNAFHLPESLKFEDETKFSQEQFLQLVKEKIIKKL